MAHSFEPSRQTLASKTKGQVANPEGPYGRCVVRSPDDTAGMGIGSRETYAAGRARVVRVLVEDEHLDRERAEKLAVSWERFAQLAGLALTASEFWTEAEGWLIAASQLGGQ